MAEGRVFVVRRGKTRSCRVATVRAQKPQEGLSVCGCTGHHVSREPSYIVFRGSPGWGSQRRSYGNAPPAVCLSPSPPPAPSIPVGSERERSLVLGAPAGLEKAIEEAGSLWQRCWNGEGSAPLLRKSKLLSWQVLHPEGCISCLRKSLGLFLGRGREEPGLQLDNGLLGRAL